MRLNVRNLFLTFTQPITDHQTVQTFSELAVCTEEFDSGEAIVLPKHYSS